MNSFVQNLKEVFINWLNRKNKCQYKKQAKGKFSKYKTQGNSWKNWITDYSV